MLLCIWNYEISNFESLRIIWRVTFELWQIDSQIRLLCCLNALIFLFV